MGSNGESVNWLPDGLIITSVPPEPQGTTATCAVTAKSNTRFPFDPREPWTLVAGPFHSLSTSHVNSAIAGGTDSLSPHDSAACHFLFRRGSSISRHNNRSLPLISTQSSAKTWFGGSAKRFYLFIFFVLNFY
jgi:hypothetical protein